MSQTPSENYDRHIEKLKTQLADFANVNELNEAQVTSLDKVIKLFGEKEEDYAKLTEATRSRHKTARKLLCLVLREFGYDIFFLCIFALSITTLGTIKTQLFTATLRTWWTGANVPSSFKEITTELLNKHKSALPTIALATAPQKRPWAERSLGEEQTFEGSSGKRLQVGEERGHLNEFGWLLDESGNAGPALETDDEVDEVDEDEGGGKRLEQLEGPLAGLVYQLQPMDAILVLASGKLDVHLTMPHRQGAKSFISFECSEKLALRFLRKRRQVMELSQPPEPLQLLQPPQSLHQHPQMFQYL
ncbi:hypothetical protein QBC46DRAFT_399920 [Diplogelasinospora grovesii]|uniref:Uncharacterized protein n=1 Tax=Diplogelasinospora grovesii TaxID=303347 RepID=A0AAN6MXN7_9PEZI|nr:hypothetical protein QBC46DRAFT_399920 [Diplogelasinospora grovesii]